MFHQNIEMTEAWLWHVSAQMPLDAFVALGTLVEEILSPIPIYMIMGVAGALAVSQGKSALYILYLALVAGVMKTLGFYLLYVIGDKLENVFRGIVVKYFRVSETAIEAAGARFTGNRWRDGSIIFISRAMPIFPSTPVSLACGVFRINLKVYLVASFLGVVVKGALYAYSAYYGVTVLSEYWEYLHNQLQYLGPALLVIGVAVIGLILYHYRKKAS